MKDILLPTDFSSNAHNAISYALNFYNGDICEFTLLHSFQAEGYLEDSIFVPIPERSLKIEKENKEKKLNMLIQEIKMRYPNQKHRFNTICQNQALVPLLNKTVKESPFELIVIGTQGITNSTDLAYGANTIQILEEVMDCPIFAIPSHVRFSHIQEIVLATGFKTKPQPKEFFFIKEFINKTHGELRILYIEESGGLSSCQEKNKKTLIEILQDVPHTFHSLAHVSVAIGIYCFSQSRGSDIITFINKKHSFFENVLFNPLYKDLGNYSRIPVLVVQTKKSEF